MNYNITISKTVKEFISNVGFDEKYGARPIKRAIQEKIEDLISEEVLRGTITENKPFILDMKDEEELIVKKGN
jgi:ATP-dependent Clp protease ATP-binding subunit ClpC